MLLQNRRRGFWWGRERVMCMPRKLTRLHSVMACQAFCHNTSPGKSHTAHRSWAWLVHNESPFAERHLPSAWQRGSDRSTGRWRCSCLSQGRETQCSHWCLLSCPFLGNELIRSAAWMAQSQNTDICLCGTSGQCLGPAWQRSLDAGVTLLEGFAGLMKY